MKNFILSLSMLLAVSMQLVGQTAPETLAIGTAAPKTDLKMKDISGKEISLNDAKQPNGLLVIFTCNSCPFVVGSEGSQGWEGRYQELKKFADAHKVGLILVNSNEAKRDKGENLQDMKARAHDKGYSDCYYTLDTNSELANAFYARTTPHVYLFDKNMKLVYKGSIDDNVDDSTKVTAAYLKNAISAMAYGKQVDPAETKPVGCSIKRAS